jgi:hypothetical protein
MSSYRIVCTEREDSPLPSGHSHIVAVGTGQDADRASKQWTESEVIAAMTQDDFYTIGTTSGKRAAVESVHCSCGRLVLRSAADAETDNNLDSLRTCRWSKASAS